MVVSVAAVISVDGKLTRGEEFDISQWTSEEEKAQFKSLKAHYDVIVMGSNTYLAIRDTLKLNPKHLRIILTTKPEQFADQAVAGQLEFINETPKGLVSRLEAEGKKNLLIAGGGQMITDFLGAKLVDNFYLTVEPYIFGEGKPFTKDTILNTSLELVSSQTLNKKGTVLLIYKVR